MNDSVSPLRILWTRLAQAALIATLTVVLLGNELAQAQDQKISVQQGQSTSHVLSGDDYRRLSSVRVLQRGRETRSVTATLARSERGGLTLNIRAAADAATGGYTLEGLFGRDDRKELPISLEVTATRSSGDRTQGGRQSGGRNQGQRGSGNDSQGTRDSQGNRGSQDGRGDRTDRNQRSQDRRSTDPNRRQTDRDESDRDRRSQNNQTRRQAVLEISPSGKREIQLADARYRSVTELRVVVDGEASDAFTAKLERNRQGMTILLAAAENASVDQYTVQGKINNRWVTIPLEVRVAELPREFAREGDELIYRHREVITLEDGTRVVIGGETQNEGDDEPFVPTPVITAWSPTKFGELGGTLTLEGTNLADDLVVKIGDKTLPIQEQTATQITVRLPDSSDDCPPGALQVRRESGSLIRSCEPNFFVRGDKVLHHLVESTSHDYINSFVMARFSRVVYNDYYGVTSWNGFKNGFENEVRGWGANTVDFLRSTGGPGDTELAIVSTPAVIVIVFRGSESFLSEEGGFSDWFNTNPDTDQLNVSSWQANAWVHEGFYNAYDDIHSELVDKVTSLRNNGQSIFVTGHSLGGALSTMAAYRLKDAGFPIKSVYTFGSPRVGNSEWLKAYDNEGLHTRTQRWVNRQDFAPRYPASGEWHHVGLTNNIHENGSVRLNDREVSVVAIPSPIDHNMDTYVSEILQELSVSQKNKVEDAAQ